ncbi:uncharacterized protein LOC141664468 [Apium graveolens]|uniref:uncharacterized protein LOC141664468 n=1 Tax=Apium graveolens TaxID=4045 RepID=UPI003D798E07
MACRGDETSNALYYGVFLCIEYGILIPNECFPNMVYLWNPSIRISKTLHVPDTAIPCDDPVSGPFTMGIAFGYFPDINDYRVIKLEKFNYNRNGEVKSEFHVGIYSLSTNSWRTVSKDKFITFSNYELHNSVVVNGVAYWVGIKFPVVQGGRIVCYDTKNETIREIMLPP